MGQKDCHIRVILAIIVLLCFIFLEEQCFQIQSAAAAVTLSTATDCACPGDQLMYQCLVQGGFATVWSGSALGCQHGIILRHSGSNPAGECNNGHLVAQIIDTFNSTFTSQLNVTVSEDMNNQTIECLVEYVNGTMLTMRVIEVNTIIVASEFFIESAPDVNDINLAHVNTSHITFSWSNRIEHNACSASVRYTIHSINCGKCPNIIPNTKASCTLPVQDSSRDCTFIVQSQACGNVNKNTRSITIIPKVPDPPEVKYSPRYNNGKLININTIITYHMSQTFNISDGIDGSPIHYTILYSDSSSVKQCGYAVIEISSSSCEGAVCTHMFDISSSSCPPSTDISVSVFATNILGNGSYSTAVQIGAILRFSDKGNEYVSYLLPSISAVLLLLCLCITPIIIIIIRAKCLKIKLNNDIQGHHESDKQNVAENVVYDEVDQFQQTPQTIHTSENIAYSQMHCVPHPEIDEYQIQKTIHTARNIAYCQLNHTPRPGDHIIQ